MTNKRVLFLVSLWCINCALGQAKEGYDLWLGYSKIQDSSISEEYLEIAQYVYVQEGTAVLDTAGEELKNGFEKLLGRPQDFATILTNSNTLIVSKRENLALNLSDRFTADFDEIGREGYILKSIQSNGNSVLILSANEDIGILYGVFRLLHLMQTGQKLSSINLVDAPKIDLRMLNHWDNLDRTVERGYAGFSIWNWQKLPEYIDPRYIDYARANASIGINAVSLTNVNANALVLTPMYLKKVTTLANVFRSYGIKVFFTARFSAPVEIGGLDTADPLDVNVQEWWNSKAKEIYGEIPDFGGFLVKANSEGQPGPQNYDRTHAEGANMLAKAVKPFNGTVIWRAFVYSEHDSDDRAKQAYAEFVPLDGKFLENVVVQTKNGPIDFQPREPLHPLFGAMPNTSQMIEFQITQEYLGFSTHLVFLPKLFEEVLDSETYRKEKGSTVAEVVDGTFKSKRITGMAGVANIGTDLNWTGHPFAQANWYGFGKLAWNPYLSSETIAEEWLRATYTNNPKFVEPIREMMLNSREAVVNYMNPLGLHHIFDTGHHYGPGPWVSELSRPAWNPTYYHNADVNGIGFDRTASGSNAIAQYSRTLEKIFGNLETCPKEYLLWFHHLPWDYKLKNGETLWNEMALKYQEGVDQVESMITTWKSIKPYLKRTQYEEVAMLLTIQLKEAKWWRDACLLYFQTFSKKELPLGVDKPSNSLDYFKSLKFPFAPGTRPRWN
ncbi:alpha-glucuronidase family glycosyl hydrolase [Maribacter aestuarii]|uniref:alpha-glucuronidase family glycosyl hydrolase n=1 Tax=Maribacter aestuarii TaxID=1130723 RepID=UPI0025A4E86F|nr:alpha-glucuronidase family glycosyl hydrolase [Maribacter aestuarii]